MSRSYLPFIDWLKCVGMVLICYGHLAGWAPLAAFPPIYLKQLGVAFFLFAAGYSLARERRARLEVVFNRLFELFLFGLACAVIVSVAGFATGTGLHLSNFLPFLAGINVVFNNFPANPTTWYLGTYVQIVLLWAVLAGRLRVSPAVLVCACAFEILVRATLMETAGLFIAYMTLPNWLTVLLLGYQQGQRETRQPASAIGPAVALVVVVGAWAAAMRLLPFDQTFPLMTLPEFGPAGGALLVSAMVTAVYVGTTWLAYGAFLPLNAPAAVQFIARNTLVIFLAHMPLLFAIEPTVTRYFANPAARTAIYMTLSLPGLGLVSEGLRRLVKPRELRDRVYAALVASPAAAARHPESRQAL